MTLVEADPMRALFADGLTEVEAPDDARQLAGLAASMSALAVVWSIVASAALIGAGTAVVAAVVLFFHP